MASFTQKCSDLANRVAVLRCCYSVLSDVHFISLTTVSVHHLPQEKDTFVQVLVGHWWHLAGRSNTGNNLKYIKTFAHHDMM